MNQVIVEVKTLHFEVDSALLRELGERLVGKPHIALAELIKNSFDADATKVLIRFLPEEDKIEIEDNGHGMSFDEFRIFWMRIGSPHKEEKRTSPYLGRPMTGSKGVGRLAVQFLANKIEIHTVAIKKTTKGKTPLWGQGEKSELQVNVDWSQAIEAGQLTRAKASYEKYPNQTIFPESSQHGTKIILTGLNQKWDAVSFKQLAQEIWFLRSPFRRYSDYDKNTQQLNVKKQNSSQPEANEFDIELDSPHILAVTDFTQQMNAIVNLWDARLIGRLLPPQESDKASSRLVNLSLEFSDGTNINWRYDAPNDNVSRVDFEIRVFKLEGRQRYNINVDNARDYMREHGGVHVYDAGFNLPYYGKPESDWLKIELAHARRLTTSELLPKDLQIKQGLQFLPTLSRLVGIVNVNTAEEHHFAVKRKQSQKGEYLKLQVTRDRLVDNAAYDCLKDIIRTALDFYSVQQKRRALEESQKHGIILSEKFKSVEQVLKAFEDEIPPNVLKQVHSKIKEVVRATEIEAETTKQQFSLLGSLATAGISAIAFQHEVTKQYYLLDGVAEELTVISASNEKLRRQITPIVRQLKDWLGRARETRALFSHLANEENRSARGRFKVKVLIEQVKEQIEVFTRGIEIETDGIENTLRLPEGNFAEWSAIFQNILLNAVNALLDSKNKRISISSHAEKKIRKILIQDTGSGVNLEKAFELFEPFVRKQKISSERQQLGLGGTGLGLTIVRMIATNLNCKVSFVEPSADFKTAVQLSWEEEK